MNIELYLQSGIVESYALGLATPVEVAEFEQLMPHYPELKEALSDFEYHLELFAIDNEEPPPPGLKNKIEDRLRDLPAVQTGAFNYGFAGGGSTPNYIAAEVSSNYLKVHKGWRIFLICLFILSKILLAFSIFYFIEYRHAQKEIIRLERQAGK